jgi:hypothetical protein
VCGNRSLTVAALIGVHGAPLLCRTPDYAKQNPDAAHLKFAFQAFAGFRVATLKVFGRFMCLRDAVLIHLN